MTPNNNSEIIRRILYLDIKACKNNIPLAGVVEAAGSELKVEGWEVGAFGITLVLLWAVDDSDDLTVALVTGASDPPIIQQR